MYVIPPIFFILSIIVFTAKFKLHGEYMESITQQVEQARQTRLVAANQKTEIVNE